MKNWFVKYNPFYVFYEFWDCQKCQWCCGRMNILKAYITLLFKDLIIGEGIEDFSIIPRKNIIFEKPLDKSPRV